MEQNSAKAVTPRLGRRPRPLEGLSLGSTLYKSKQPLFPADATARLGWKSICDLSAPAQPGTLADAGAWARGRNDGGLLGSGRLGLLTAEKGARFG